MAFGIKSKSIKTQNTYSLESLFEAIKDRTFTAGVPSLATNAGSYAITFPALDNQNQVCILKSGFGMETRKFTVEKCEKVGIENMVTNMAINSATHGLFGLGSSFGKNAKRCEELVEITAKELAAMGL